MNSRIEILRDGLKAGDILLGLRSILILMRLWIQKSSLSGGKYLLKWHWIEICLNEAELASFIRKSLVQEFCTNITCETVCSFVSKDGDVELKDNCNIGIQGLVRDVFIEAVLDTQGVLFRNDIVDILFVFNTNRILLNVSSKKSVLTREAGLYSIVADGGGNVLLGAALNIAQVKKLFLNPRVYAKSDTGDFAFYGPDSDNLIGFYDRESMAELVVAILNLFIGSEWLIIVSAEEMYRDTYLNKFRYKFIPLILEGACFSALTLDGYFVFKSF